MRRCMMWAIALPFLFALGAALALGALAAAPAVASMPAQQGILPKDCPSFCIGQVRRAPINTALLSGETVDMTLGGRFRCWGYSTPLHIVVAVDSSEKIGRQEMEQTKSGLRRFVDGLDLPRNPYTLIALVDMTDAPRTLAPLTNDPERLNRAIGKLEAEGESGLDQVIDEARRHMIASRELDCNRTHIIEIMILIAADSEPSHCGLALRAARKAKSQGILLIVVCAMDRRCQDARCLLDLASSRRYRFELANMDRLIPLIDRVREDHFINSTMRALTVLETLGDDVTYVTDSAQSQQGGEVEVDGQKLTWRIWFVPRDGVTMTYQVRPLGLGLKSLSKGTEVTWLDNLGREGRQRLGPTWVHVLAPRVVRP